MAASFQQDAGEGIHTLAGNDVEASLCSAMHESKKQSWTVVSAALLKALAYVLAEGIEAAAGGSVALRTHAFVWLLHTVAGAE